MAALAVLSVSAVADWYAVRHHLPFAFHGHGDVGREREQWMSNGTALGPPLAPMVLLALALPFAAARRWWGAAADVACLVVAAAMLLGTVGEPTTFSVFEPGSVDVPQAALRVLMIAGTGALAALAVVDLARRRRGVVLAEDIA